MGRNAWLGQVMSIEPLLASTVDGLPWNERKEQFSIGFVRLVAGAAGCWVKTHSTDFDGVDITIVSSADYATFYCPEFELQLKCTAQQDLLREDVVAWTMSEKPFTKLTNPKRYTPAYLGVLVVPEDPDGWLEQDDKHLMTRSLLYWTKASDLRPVSEDTASRTVHIPRSNLFDVPRLLGIMKSIGEGGDR
jgi:hypothetical protein